MQCISLCPTLPNSMDDDVNLILSEHPSGTFCKRGHGNPRDPIGSRLPHDGIVGDGQVDGIVEGDGCSPFTVLSMAASAVLPI